MRSIKEIFRSYAVLNSEGKHVNGTDKQSNHNYGDAYEDILFNPKEEGIWLPNSRPTRDSTKLMMEVGIADGSSLLAWREVFPNAICVGMDIHHSDKAHGERIEFYKGDQRSYQDCMKAVAGRQFDFICEDATHLLEDTIRTLLFLWPHVRQGGIYVIEEFPSLGYPSLEAMKKGIKSLLPFAEVVETQGPFGGIEPLVVLRRT